jgi:hypothetical protein
VLPLLFIAKPPKNQFLLFFFSACFLFTFSPFRNLSGLSYSLHSQNRIQSRHSKQNSDRNVKDRRSTHARFSHTTFDDRRRAPLISIKGPMVTYSLRMSIEKLNRPRHRFRDKIILSRPKVCGNSCSISQTLNFASEVEFFVDVAIGLERRKA